MLVVGAPLDAPPMFDAPTPLAPVKATTVSDWFTGAPSTLVADCVLVMLTLVSTPGAVAVQISATPRAIAARWTRVQVSPPPEMVRLCVFVPAVGPSEAANASKTSPAAAVVNGAVVRAPVPSENTIVSTAGPAAAAPSETTSATALFCAPFDPAAGVRLMRLPAR